MKRLIITALAAVALLLPAAAQCYHYSKYYNPETGRLDYGRHDSGLGTGNMYYGFRIGPATKRGRPCGPAAVAEHTAVP